MRCLETSILLTKDPLNGVVLCELSRMLVVVTWTINIFRSQAAGRDTAPLLSWRITTSSQQRSTEEIRNPVRNWGLFNYQSHTVTKYHHFSCGWPGCPYCLTDTECCFVSGIFSDFTVVSSATFPPQPARGPNLGEIWRNSFKVKTFLFLSVWKYFILLADKYFRSQSNLSDWPLNEKLRIFLEIFLVNYFPIDLSRSVIFSDKWARYSFTIEELELGQDLALISSLSSQFR